MNRPDFNIPRIAAAAGLLTSCLALSLAWQPAAAWPGYGEVIDNFCVGYDGSTPYKDLGGNGCLLCHQNNSGSGSQPGTWTWWRSGTYTLFCTGTPPNRAPDGTITSPGFDIQVAAGSTVRFEGQGTDPDGDSLSYAWSFDIGTASGPGPHFVNYANPGTYVARLTVADETLTDPTPPSRRITVTAPTSCIDADGDGFETGDASCAPLDCDDADSLVNPGAIEDCSDGIDNNCNGLIDIADASAVGCAGCLDSDGDLFSPEGGTCGPIDCDDTDAAVNPGAVEICNDGVDNDCDYYLDETDAECSGEDCIGALLPVPSFPVLVSLEPDRWMAEPLEGLSVSESMYVFVADQPGITQVRWLLDGAPHQTENKAPWDFAGTGAGVANPFNTRELTNGWHSIFAEVQLQTGRSHGFGAAFLVANRALPQAPSCTIDQPSGPKTIRVGDRVEFAGTGLDPDAALPLSFAWDFGGAAPAVSIEDPGSIRFEQTGTFKVSFTVTDNSGLSCPTPASVEIKVEAADEPFTAHAISTKYVTEGHKKDWERRPASCRTCHGSNLSGTAASSTFADRVWPSKERQPDGSKLKRYSKGAIVGCMDCHRLELKEEDDREHDD